ncbi:MAG TPA: DUF488 domain-containing protein [Pyrinomonadaceae bacterium]
MNHELSAWTVGHSTRSADEFGNLLRSHQIKILVDVRSYPSSSRHPHFEKRALSEYLSALDILYIHAPLLGGRRSPKKDSSNTAWRNASFRAYADYMETAPFQQGVRELLEVAARERTAIMCAESLWWRCHRSLISDYLKAKGVSVLHILSETKTELHPYTAAAKIVDGELSYRGLLDVEG